MTWLHGTQVFGEYSRRLQQFWDVSWTKFAVVVEFPYWTKVVHVV
jgi:hypothetical protein